MVPEPLSRAARSTRRGVVATALAVGLLASPTVVGPAHADVAYVPWSTYLSGWTDSYIPSSANDCVAGRSSCVKQTVRELDRILDSAATSCSHQAVFALAYTRITQTYAWTTGQPGYYDDVNFSIHQAAVFAKHYTDAYTNWLDGNRRAVPRSWLIAFDAAAGRKVTGSGDLLLGMNAHINRDLPYVIASVGLVAPDGSSRKPDFDKVNKFLAEATKPLIAEEAHRLDPTMDDSGDSLDASYSAILQLIVGWRENAWRNAERLISARTADERAQVAASIESEAVSIARTIKLGFPVTTLTWGNAARDQYCRANNAAAAPEPYPFGTPRPYGL